MAEPSDSNTTTGTNSGGEANTQYIAFLLVPFFFLLGLLGVLICHILKRKGYRCTTETEEDQELEKDEDEEDKDPEKGDLNETFSECNADTVGQIVQYIMKNEANTDALKAMVQDSIDSEGVPVTPTSPNTPNSPNTPTSPNTPNSPLSPALPGFLPSTAKHTCNHLHTIGGASGHKNICNRCNQKKWPLMRRLSSKRIERRSLMGEVTVLSVGRFRVTKCDPKLARDRRTLLITEPNGSVPSSPAKADPPALSTGAQSQVKRDDAK